MADDRPGERAAAATTGAPEYAFAGGVASVLAAFAILWTVVPYGMIAHDEGQYGQSAIRILGGELPHRDFHEMYSGGLSYWHALLFRLFGEQLVVLRRAMVVLAMPAVLAAYAIALRFTASSVLAAIVAVAGIIASVGTMHTVWANLYLGFVSMIIAWLLVRYCDDEQTKWIVAAGVLCGVGIAIKITGLYTLAATALAITFCGTDRTASPADRSGPCDSTGWFERGYRWAVAAAAIAAGPLLVAAHPTANTLAYFAVPTISMGVALLAAGRRFSPRVMAQRHAMLCGAAAAVLLVFMTPWIAAGATSDLVDGLFIRPRVRLGSAAYYPPTALISCILALPLTIVCVASTGWKYGRPLQWLGAAAVAGLLAMGLGAAPGSALSGNRIRLALEGWRWFPAVAFPIAAVMLARAAEARPLAAAQAFATMALAAFFALNQYPFASPAYFFFTAPTTILAAVAIAGLSARPPDSGSTERHDPASRGGVRFRAAAVAPAVACAAALAGFCLLRFGVEGFFREFYPRTDVTDRRTLSGLVLPAWRVEPYAALRDIFDTTLRADQTILAGPDCPEVYFFTGRPNLTPVMYDIFADRDALDAQLARLAGDDRIGGVVFNTISQFSPLWEEDLGRRLIRRMRQRVQVGKFIVYFDTTPGQAESTPAP